MITLSFDDGWQCIYDNALPILEEADIKSTHYIVSSYLHREQFPHYMNLEHVKDLEQKGHEIGCHSVSHKHLISEPAYVVESEVYNSQKFLKEQGLTIETFAYPYGEYNNDIVDTVKRAGFIGARSIIEGYNVQDTNPFLLTCQRVMVTTTVSQVKEWVEHCKANKVWLILMFHQIDNEGREWSTTPQKLSEIVYFIRNQNMPVVTIKEGIKKMDSLHKE